MKRCPICSQTFGNEYDFCLNDGAALASIEGTLGPTVFEIPDETPTQTLPRQQNVVTRQQIVESPFVTPIVPPAAAEPPRSSNSWLYLIIGVLATALVAVGIYAFFVRGDQKKSDTVANVSPAPSALPESSPTPAQSPATTPKNPPTPTPGVTPPPFGAIAAPNGNFGGKLAYATGTTFSAQAELATGENGVVRGRIVWTLLRTTNPAKMDKIGVSASEFVQGQYDPVSKSLVLTGLNKSDPADLIILDKYRLKMSTDGRRLTGYSFGGRNRGSLTLQH